MRRSRIRRLTLLAVLLALMAVLSYVEHLLPPLPLLPPGVRLGLANVVSMYALFFLGWREALALGLLKSLFVFLTRGFVAGLLSLCGGWLSIGVMLLLLWLSRRRLSTLLLSVAGAVAHNAGQLLAASLLLGTPLLWAYAPVLLGFGVLMGSVTAVLLRVVLPLIKAGTAAP